MSDMTAPHILYFDLDQLLFSKLHISKFIVQNVQYIYIYRPPSPTESLKPQLQILKDH